MLLFNLILTIIRIYYLYCFFIRVQTVFITQNCADKSSNGRESPRPISAWIPSLSSEFFMTQRQIAKKLPLKCSLFGTRSFYSGIFTFSVQYFLNRNRPKGHLTSNIIWI